VGTKSKMVDNLNSRIDSKLGELAKNEGEKAEVVRKICTMELAPDEKLVAVLCILKPEVVKRALKFESRIGGRRAATH